MQTHAKDSHISLICYKGTVYDVTEFRFAHPGGIEAMLPFINGSVDSILFNPQHHNHSKEIIWKLEKLKYGYIKPKKENQLTPLTQPQSHKLITRVGSTRRLL
jgi:cytochrome b involved in lipid metabolism